MNYITSYAANEGFVNQHLLESLNQIPT